MQIKYSKTALKFLYSLDKKSVERIRYGIQGLTQDPPVGDIKPMQGVKGGQMRLRIGAWRIIYKYTNANDTEELVVIDIGNRGDIYK